MGVSWSRDSRFRVGEVEERGAGAIPAALARPDRKGKKEERRRIGMQARRRAERISSEKLTRDAAKTMSRVARDIPNC